MNALKPKSLEKLEEKMENLDAGSMRYTVLKCAKDFKSSWVSLGRALYTVWKDKLYKDWGYTEFDTYTTKEIGIRKQTAIKLLKSYYFLEKEEPAYLEQSFSDSQEAAAVPSFESVDVLRRAKNRKELDQDDYSTLKKEVFEKGRDASGLRKDLTSLIRERKEFDPEEARQRRKSSMVRRLVATLKSIKQDVELAKMLPAPLIRETSELIKKLEAELS